MLRVNWHDFYNQKKNRKYVWLEITYLDQKLISRIETKFCSKVEISTFQTFNLLILTRTISILQRNCFEPMPAKDKSNLNYSYEKSFFKLTFEF